MSGIMIGVVSAFFVFMMIFMIIGIYNSLVKYKNRYENAFAQIEVQLKRRYDLIPNLIETAKGAMKHESETLEAVINARNAAMTGLKNASQNPGDPTAMQELVGAESALMGAMSRLNVVMEAYPDLKANQNMMQLSEELTSTENKISFARQAFNDAVTSYNTYRQSFPAVMLASKFNHNQNAQLLEFAESEAMQEAPKVSF